ncbi:hypothetical protein [Henriciella sp.]|uniref:hypothetical protein n=1 Tax=Henriciella sp. TaxID=1968823 RepID=UPI000C0D4F93|nr:hypothetical protein [Henriciella sp.]PHR83144.1 MAG: hypothetical protein COA64_00365 [Henriciella sp.]
MTQLNDIIERLEKATEGSWELDARVYAEAVGSDEVFNGCTLPEAIEQFPNHCGGICGVWGIPNLTTDLNAALALVEERLGSLHDLRFGLTVISSGWGTAIDLNASTFVTGEAKTPALAVCIALLKALAEEKNDG